LDVKKAEKFHHVTVSIQGVSTKTRVPVTGGCEAMGTMW